MKILHWSVLAVSIASTQWYYHSQKSGEGWLREQCALENKNWTGQVFDGVVRGDRVYQGPGMRLTFEGTILNRDASDFSPEDEVRIKQQLKNEPSLKEQFLLYAEKGVSVECNFYGRDQKLVTTVTF